MAVNVVGEKLSKQTLAAPIDASQPVPVLNAALAFLGQDRVDCGAADTASFWEQAIAGWAISRVPQILTRMAQD